MKLIKCSNEYICQINTEEINNNSVLKLDFNITAYMILLSGKGWTEIPYPEQVLSSIKDKIYITKEKLYNIIEILDTFIETGDIETAQATKNARGFSNINNKDMYNNDISIQKSSSMGEDQLWFGTKINHNDIGYKENDNFILYKYQPNHGVNVHDRLHLTQEQAFQLRMAMLSEIAPKLTSHDIADLVDKKTTTGNNMIMDMWGSLSSQIQRINFMYACGQGNLDLVKSIYRHTENKFMDELFCTFEEFGLQMSMQPESKKILKFFKEMMKEKNMELSFEMEKWVIENKLGRKIKIR